MGVSGCYFTFLQLRGKAFLLAKNSEIIPGRYGDDTGNRVIYSGKGRILSGITSGALEKHYLCKQFL
jgi:hypothetical protein